MLRLKRIILSFTFLLTLIALAVAGGFFFSPEAQADTTTTIQIAIPANVAIVVGPHEVVFIGRPTSISSVACAPGIPQPQTVNVVNPGGGSAAQITGVLAFHDHEIPLGSRYTITEGPAPCNTDLKLYTGTLVE